MYHCKECIYLTDRKYNLQRHFHKKHMKNIQNSVYSDNGQNVSPSGQNVSFSNFLCSKCNKTYKTYKHLRNHELSCCGVDELTCCKCMTSFTTRSAKSRHIKLNNCKARSIIHARIPNLQNISSIVNNNNINNNNINNINNSVTNNYTVNNFGSERTDYISNEVIYKTLISGMNTLPLYIEMKHFNKDFPENNNIAFTNENKCKVLENNVWKEQDLSTLSSKLIHDNSEVLLVYCEDNELELSNLIKNDELFEHVKDKLVIIYNKADSKKYNEVLSKIKDLVKNNKA